MTSMDIEIRQGWTKKARRRDIHLNILLRHKQREGRLLASLVSFERQHHDLVAGQAEGCVFQWSQGGAT